MAEVKHLMKLDCSAIQEGVVFSAPVYFDDGKNMFLAAGAPAKQYHLDALSRWKIPYLLTGGTKLDPSVLRSCDARADS